MKYIKKLLMLLMTCLLIIVCVACEFNTKNNNKQDNEYTAEKGTVKEGFIRINGEIRKITYTRINGKNIYQGDILIADEQLLSTSGLKTKSVVLTSRTWTNNIVNFHISSNVYNEGIIRTAIDHLRKNTNLKFIESTLGNYVDFTLSSIPGVSYSYLGMLGIGRQEIGISQYAMVGSVVHEIGHAIGLEHEHTRADRDDYVTIHYENIDEDYRHNFDINNTVNHEDDGVFDFLSIMLYSSYDFTINNKPTITRKDGSTFGAQSTGLSGGDISGVKRLYGLAAANPVIAVKSADDTYILNHTWLNDIHFEAQLLPAGFGYVLADRKTFTIQNFSECALTINNCFYIK